MSSRVAILFSAVLITACGGEGSPSADGGGAMRHVRGGIHSLSGYVRSLA